MSTSIHGGLLLPVRDPFAIIPPLRQQVREDWKNAYIRHAVASFSQLYDNAFVTAKKDWEKTTAVEILRKLSLLLKELYQPPELLIGDTPTEYGYLTVAYGQVAGTDFRDYLLSQTFFVDASYYNNADRPEDIAVTEWENRRSLWENAFDLDEPFPLQAVRVDFVIDADYSTIPLEEQERSIWREAYPTEPERLKTLRQSVGREVSAEDLPPIPDWILRNR